MWEDGSKVKSEREVLTPTGRTQGSTWGTVGKKDDTVFKTLTEIWFSVAIEKGQGWPNSLVRTHMSATGLTLVKNNLRNCHHGLFAIFQHR